MSKQRGGVVPFVIGLLAALAVGWWLFPNWLYSKKTQPIRFSHKIHVEQEGLECDACHLYREDGSFAGLPTTEQCAECHMDLLGEDPAEKKFYEEYVDKGKEVPWLVYQYQPDNVYFSHNAHESYECTECHLDLAKNDDPPPYYRNRVSGYSKGTMKMWQCERCHAEHGVSNACYTCHK